MVIFNIERGVEVHVGDRIKEMRKNKKVTQKELAKRIQKSERMVQKYESGEVSPPLDVIEKIADALDVPLNDLLGVEVRHNKTYDFFDTIGPDYNGNIESINANIDIIIKDWAAYEDYSPTQAIEAIKRLPSHYIKMLADYISHINNKEKSGETDG